MRNLFDLRVLLGLFAASVAAYAFYASLDWPFRTALFPRILAVPLFCLALAEVVMSLTIGENKNRGHAVDFELTTTVEPALAAQRTVAIIAWIMGFFFLILAAGFPLAVPVFVVLYLRVVGREPWALTILLTFVSWLFVEGLFSRFLNIPFPDGWIFVLFQ